jgi:glycosyltransferase involved in cell wall biosynthesis
VMFAAMERLRRQDPETTLFATIGDSEAGRVGDGIVRLGRVSSAELGGLYAEASTLVMPSLVETVGLPLLEAAIAGLPIAAADRPYAREVCGEGAAYFDPSDVDACAREVRRLLTDETLRSRLSAIARSRAEGRIAQKPYRAMVRFAMQGPEG